MPDPGLTNPEEHEPEQEQDPQSPQPDRVVIHEPPALLPGRHGTQAAGLSLALSLVGDVGLVPTIARLAGTQAPWACRRRSAFWV